MDAKTHNEVLQALGFVVIPATQPYVVKGKNGLPDHKVPAGKNWVYLTLAHDHQITFQNGVGRRFEMFPNWALEAWQAWSCAPIPEMLLPGVLNLIQRGYGLQLLPVTGKVSVISYGHIHKADTVTDAVLGLFLQLKRDGLLEDLNYDPSLT